VFEMSGAMQFGAVNIATPELTELRSTGAVIPPGASSNNSLTTLLVTNPSPTGQGIQVGDFPGITTPTVGILSSAYAKGIWARASSSQYAVGVDATGRNGILGRSSSSGTESDAGVQGISEGRNGNGVVGEANNGPLAYGVWGKSTSGLAGAFHGRVSVYGTLSKSGGGFQIDCPGRETESYLRHSFVESPDMKNLYDGIVVLDESGEGRVDLPDWFAELNRDYRYQLTSIGQPAPDLHIAAEVAENSFRIAGGMAGSKVSWQVTGTRKDRWADANRIVVQEDKPEDLRGTYLHPEAFGEPESRGEGYRREEALRSQRAGIDQVQPGNVLPSENEQGD
jgi:hypothetical protein